MELLSIDHINEQYLLYEDSRSIKKWLTEKGVSIIKLGKKYFVQKDEFENMLRTIVGRDKAIETVPAKYKLGDQEKTIYSHLISKMTEL
jgi:hypothetical protein